MHAAKTSFQVPASRQTGQSLPNITRSGPKPCSTKADVRTQIGRAPMVPGRLGDHARELAVEIRKREYGLHAAGPIVEFAGRDGRLGDVIDHHAQAPAVSRRGAAPRGDGPAAAGDHRGCARRSSSASPRSTSGRSSQRGSGSSWTRWRTPLKRCMALQFVERVAELRIGKVDPGHDAFDEVVFRRQVAAASEPRRATGGPAPRRCRRSGGFRGWA